MDSEDREDMYEIEDHNYNSNDNDFDENINTNFDENINPEEIILNSEKNLNQPLDLNANEFRDNEFDKNDIIDNSSPSKNFDTSKHISPNHKVRNSNNLDKSGKENSSLSKGNNINKNKSGKVSSLSKKNLKLNKVEVYNESTPQVKPVDDATKISSFDKNTTPDNKNDQQQNHFESFKHMGTGGTFKTNNTNSEVKKSKLKEVTKSLNSGKFKGEANKKEKEKEKVKSVNELIQSPKQKPNKKLKTFEETLKNHANSINPNVASLAKSKLEWEKQIRSTSNVKKKDEEEPFCVAVPNNTNNEIEESDIITKGERIYMKNLAEKDLKNILEDRERKLKQQENHEGASFKPSLHLTAYYKPKNISKTIRHHLMETTCYKQKTIHGKQESEEDIKLEDEIEMMKRDKKTAPWEQIEKHAAKLHQERETNKAKKDQLTTEYYSQICPHTPSINEKTEPDPRNFYSRLQVWLGTQKEKEDKKKEEAKLLNNEPLFKPKLIPSKVAVNNRPSTVKALSEKLHLDYKEYTENRLTLMAKDIVNSKEESEKRERLLSPKSKDMNVKNKEDLYKRLFELFDYNQDGKIAYDEDFTEVQKTIPLRIKKILEPLFEEFAENKEVLTLNDFKASCERLYNILDFIDRSDLFFFVFHLRKNESSRHQRYEGDLKNLDKNCSHKPVINEITDKTLTSSSKYADTDFLKRNTKYLEEKKNVIQTGLEKQKEIEKESKIF